MRGFATMVWRQRRSAANGLALWLRERRLRLAVGLLTLLVVWGLVGGLAWSGMSFLQHDAFQLLRGRIIEGMLALFLFSLFLLVTLSAATLVWTGLFRSRHAAFHAALPISERELFWSAALENGIFAGWAVAVLAAPLVTVLALEAARPWLFVPAALASLLAFVCCCAAAGAVLALLLARLVPWLRRGFKGLIVVGVVAVVWGVLAIMGELEARRDPSAMVRQTLGGIAFAENPFLPPWWAQQALSAAAAGRWPEWLWHSGLCALAGGSLAILGEWWAALRLRQDLDHLASSAPRRERPRSRPWRVIPGLPGGLGLLVAKDLRIFLRDPAQWMQAGFFAAMLAFYLLLLPRLGRSFLADDQWKPIVSLCNLVAVAMAILTFTGRFVFPLPSLEGRRLWVLALAPWPRERILDAKLAFSILIGAPVGIGLTVLSCAMLALGWQTMLFQALAVACLACALSASALGLGARLADWREDSPGRIAAGFGGTVNLLAGLALSALVVGASAFALPGAPGWRILLVAGALLVASLAWTMIFHGLGRRCFARLEGVPG